MAEFHVTTGVSYKLENIINNAMEKLILISPFLKINDRLKQHLEDKNRLKIDVRLIYGKNELQPDENNWLKSLNYIRSSFCKNLHSKCYLNEKEAIITSMNLYEFSEVNNNEMGIYINKDVDPDLYKKVYEEAQRLIRISEEIKISVAKVPKNDEKVEKPPTEVNGFCISCHLFIPLNPMYPYCKECYKTWKKNKNELQEEKYCHICGKLNKSTLNKPGCYDCYKENKNKLEFPTSSA